MRLSDVTALGRPIDPDYATNRAIAVLSLVVMAAGMGIRLLGGMAWLDSLRWGVSAGLAVFLAWALGRELDPDHDLSAFVGAVLMVAGLFFLELPGLLLLFWLLIALRMVNRTSGLPARALDSLGLLGLGSWLTWQGQWVAGVVTAIAFVLDGWLQPPLKRHRLWAGLALAAVVVVAVFQGDLRMAGGATLPVSGAALVVGGLFVMVIAAARHVQSVGDANGERLNARRVQAAQLVALVVALATVGWQGWAGVVALLPLWAAMLGTALYQGVTNVWRPDRVNR